MIVEVAQRLADDLLFPTALDTDRAMEPPVGHLDALAEAGLYGLSTPVALGGLGADASTTGAVVEALAGGCLSTAFVWLQHLNPARAIAARPDASAVWSRDLASGTVRAGIAFAHLRRPGPPVLTARALPDGGWRLDGRAPWVSGWGRIDVVHVAAVHADDPATIVWLLVDATEAESLDAVRLPLAAMNATATVELHARGHRVPAARHTLAEPLADWLRRDAAGLRGNGSLALGLAARADRLLGDESFRDRIDDARRALDAAADPAAMAEARAEASVTALDAATALVARGGGGSLRFDAHAQRLAREALFLLVQGQTASIRERQVARLHRR